MLVELGLSTTNRAIVGSCETAVDDDDLDAHGDDDACVHTPSCTHTCTYIHINIYTYIYIYIYMYIYIYIYYTSIQLPKGPSAAVHRTVCLGRLHSNKTTQQQSSKPAIEDTS